MANVDRPNGFTPVKSLHGAPWTALVRKITAADRSADTTGNHGDIYVHDPIKLSSGKALAANSGDTVLGVVVAVGSGAMHGAAGPFTPSNLEQMYSPHADATGVTVWYVPAEGMVFEAQTATGVTAANYVVGYSCDHNVTANTAHGSRTTGISNAEIVAPSNNDLKIVELGTTPDNDVTLENARMFVTFLILVNEA